MQTINVKGYGALSFPDTMSQADIQSAIHSGISSGKLTPVDSTESTADLTPKKPFLDRFATGAEQYTNPMNIARSGVAGLLTAGQNINRTMNKIPGAEALAGFLQKHIPFAKKLADASAKEGFNPQTSSMEELAGVNDQNRNPLAEGLAQYSPLIAAGPLGLLGDAAAGTAYGATQSPDSPVMGGAVTGGSNAAFGLLNTLIGTSNPIVRAVARSLLGGAMGYSVGGKEGAAVGVGTGFIAPSLMKKVGIGKSNPVEDLVARTTPAETTQTGEAGLRIGTPLSVGEASGRPDIMAEEAAFGRAGQEGVTQKVKTGQERIGQQKQAIDTLKSQISTGSQDASFSIRDAAQNAIKELEDTRSQATSPYYKAAESEEIPQPELDKLLEVPRIKDTMHEVLNDKDLAPELGGQQPTGKKMMAMVENRIDNLIDKAKSKPYNKERIEQLQYARDNVSSDYSDPRVQSVLKEIYNDDPVFQATAMGINARGMRFLDAVKKRINTAALQKGSPLNTTGNDKYTSGLIQGAANKITDVTDQYSKNYQTARSIHEQMSPVVDEAKNGVLGRLANLSDTQLKNASKMIFDPSQTNIRVLGQLKQQIMRRNPEAWDGIVRNEIERLNKKGEISGVQFYNNVLKNDNQYKQFELALDHNPVALQTLRDMKMAWKNLSNIVTPKTAKGRAETSMDTVRQSFGAILDMVTEQVGSKQHAEAIRYLYSPKWMADAQNIRSTTNKSSQQRQFALMMAKVLPPALIMKPNQQGNQ